MLDSHHLAVALGASIVAAAAPLTWAQTVPHDAVLPEVASMTHWPDYPVDLATSGAVVVTTKANRFQGTSGAPYVPRRRAHVMRRSSSGDWVEEVELSTLLPAGTNLDERNVAIDGDTIAARLSSATTPIAIFERLNGAWTLAQSLSHPSGIAGHAIIALELQGERLFACEARTVVGGHAEVFQLVYDRTPSGWQLVTRSAPAAAPGGYVRSMDVAGDRVSIARVDPWSGQLVDVSVHTRTPGGLWVESHSLTSFAGVLDASDVYLDGDRLCAFTTGGTAILLKEADLSSPVPLTFTTGATFATSSATEAFVEMGLDDGFAMVAYRSQTAPYAGRVVVQQRRSNGAWTPIADFTPVAGEPIRRAHIEGRRVLVEFGDIAMLYKDNDVAVSDLGTLLRGTNDVSIAGQGAQPLYLRGGDERSGWSYLVLGSLSGTAPATPLGFGLELPLVVDAYTQMTLALRAPLTDALGTLDADGRAAATFSVPPGTSPSFAGLSVHHAYVAIDPVTFEAHASNAVRVDLVN